VAAGKSPIIFIITILCALLASAAPLQQTLPVAAQALLERAWAANPVMFCFGQN
jgi:hypothetical protein